ncbi:MAG: class I SAM-dependent methyltransferase [Hyphomicrobiales bacterium]
MSSNDYFDANRLSWDERVAIHAEDETGFYQVAKVLNGEDKLNAIEARELGDIAGLRVAHLQCHFGLDSFCLERRGAEVVGLDFSSAAIAKARELAKTLALKTRFVEGNVYDARKLLAGDFDMIYVTWGAINWLPDIAGWAKVVGSLLKPGGHLYLAESHPTTLCFEWVDGKIVPHYDWRTPIDKPFAADDAKTYNGSQKELRNKRVYEWIHPLSDILNGLNAAGLSLAWLREHAELTWALFPNMIEGEDGLYRLPADFPQLPLAFSLKAVKR